MKITKNINENINNLNNYYGLNKTFDIISRKILIGNKMAYLIMIDGFTKDQIMLHVISRLQTLNLEEINTDTISSFVKRNIAYIEVELSNNFDTLDSMFLSGAVIILIDGEDDFIIVDAREYPIRSINEPDLEKVTRGPRDGFTETLIFNTALIRRRVKDNNLRFIMKNVGKRTKTNIAISYIDDLVDKKLLNNILKKIDSINVESLVMAEKSLTEILIPYKWYNPLPKVRYTERPDVAASHLFEGHILLIVDTTPSVIIIPTTIFHFTQHAEDYYHNPIVGTYIRQIRFITLFISLLLIPIWYLCVSYKIYLPNYLQFLGVYESNHIPIYLQLILLELGLDILKLSSIHTPSSMNTSLGIIGGLILGNFAVQAGLFSIEAILCIALTGICSFATPSIEFSYGIKIFRMFLLLMTIIFKLPGFIIAMIIILIITYNTDNGTKTKYTYPLIPFNKDHLKHILFRLPIPKIKK